jgi:hypothetical protein
LLGAATRISSFESTKAPFFEACDQGVEPSFDHHRQVARWIGVTQQRARQLEFLLLLGAQREKKSVAAGRKRLQRR